MQMPNGRPEVEAGEHEHEHEHELLPDIHLLRSSLLSHEFKWEGTVEDHVRWEALLERYAVEGDADVVVGDVKEGQEDGTATTMSFSVQLQEEPEVRLLVDAPLNTRSKKNEGKKSVGSKTIALSVSSPVINTSTSSSTSSQHLESLKHELDVRWKQSAEEGLENRLFDLYMHLKSSIADHPIKAVAQQEGNPTAANSTTPSSLLSLQSTIQETAKGKARLRIPIYRQIFYTHHLLSPIKQKELAAWSAELSTWLLVKLGYPGFLVLEGPKYGATTTSTATASGNGSGSGNGDGALELSKRIRGMQWAKLSARTEVDWELELQQEDLARAGGDLEKCVLLACPLARACCVLENGDGGVADGGKDGGGEGGWENQKGKMMEGDKKVRSCIRKTETVKEIVDLLRSTGIPEQELIDGLSLRVGGAG